jgi:TolB-like protein/tetratricopeptide (TPR) repeat protein
MDNMREIDKGAIIAPDPNPLPPPDVVRAALADIIGGRTFRSAQSQIRFFRYVVEETLAGRGYLIKEYLIGTAALGRGDDFDPRLDPIVRTQARKLRARLDKYYQTEGAGDVVRIEFRKGSYEPSFKWMSAQAEKDALPPVVVEPIVIASVVFEPVVIESVVEPVFEPAMGKPAGLPSWKSADSRSKWSKFGKFRIPTTWTTLAAALVLCASAGISYTLGTGWRPGHGAAQVPSIAVIPFVNLNEDHADEFLSDGLTVDLIDSLKQVPGLQVSARSSAFRFKGRASDIAEISRQLRVRTVLVGSIRKSGDRLRVTAQLDSAPAGYHLWTGSFDTDAHDARTIPWEIARAVTNVLGPSSLRDGGKDFADAFPNRNGPNPGAYENYLKGLYFWNKLSAEGLTTAIGYFQQAIAEDPSFARAYAALAHCYVMTPQLATSPSPEALAMIRDAASRALELDGRLGEAHFDIAVAAEYEFDWKTAEAEFRRGLELNPGSMIGHLWYAKFLALQGRRDEVLVQRKIAAEIDPVSPYAVQSLGGYFSVVGRYDEAVAQFQSSLALDPNFGLAHQGLGMTYLLQGKNDQAIQEFQLANKSIAGPRRMALLGWAYAKCGRTVEARKILEDFLRQDKRTLPALAVAQVYLGLDDKNQAFVWLNKAIDQRDLDETLLWDSPYDSLRSDPRFVTLLSRMKLG